MIYKNIARNFIAFIAILITAFLLIVDGQALAANYALEIIQPREGLDTKNRFYKAYPGLQFNVRVAVIGGAYPFTYELVTSPSGMTIRKDTGEITWQNPTASGSSSTTTVQVTDKEGSKVSVTWTITVTTGGFRFLDAVNGKIVAEGGTGTISNPWKTIKDMYEGDDYSAKFRNSYAHEFLYFRAGTYTMDGYIESNVIPLIQYNKPVVWLAYPGESPTLDLGNASLKITSGTNNWYLQGFTINNITNPKARGIQISSSGNNITFYKNTFHDLPTLGTPGGNQSAIMIRAASYGFHKAFLNNTFYDIGLGYGLLSYSSSKVLFADNVMHDMSDPVYSSSLPIGPKKNNKMWFIRGNKLYNMGSGTKAIWLYGAGEDNEDFEVSYNFVQVSGKSDALDVKKKSVTFHGKHYIFRNTFVGNLTFRKIGSNHGPYHVYNNVIVNGLSTPDHIDCKDCTDPSRIITTDNLTGFPTDNIVDSNGRLTAAYSSFLGTHGHQVVDGPAPPIVDGPAPPSNLTVK